MPILKSELNFVEKFLELNQNGLRENWAINILNTASAGLYFISFLINLPALLKTILTIVKGID